MRILTVSQGESFHTGLPTGSIRHLLENEETIVWLDIQDPVEVDIALLRSEFGFHPLAVEDAIRSHERPKVDAYEHATLRQPDVLDDQKAVAQSDDGSAPGRHAYYFVVFYEAQFEPTDDEVQTEAINLFIGRNFLVTVHYGDTRHVRETMMRWKAPGSPMGNTIGALVHAFLDAMVDDYFPVMDKIADRVEDIENSIFDQFNEEAIQSIFRLKKDLLGLRRIVAPERDVLNVLLRRELSIFAVQEVAYLQDVYDHLVRVIDSIDTYRDLLSSALDSYLSLQSNQLNQIVKVLTITSIVLMAASLIASIYGMNFANMPELRWPIGHLWAIFLMIIVTVALVAYFRRRKWL
jgi:magnesium transporter